MNCKAYNRFYFNLKNDGLHRRPNKFSTPAPGKSKLIIINSSLTSNNLACSKNISNIEAKLGQQ